MTFSKVCLLGLALFAVLFIIFGLTLPREYSVEREITVTAPKHTVQDLVSDLARWPEWTPWQEADPTLKVTTSEQTQGVGATQSWKGEKGAGRLEITADNDDGIAYETWFDNGKLACKSTISYKVADSATVVIWRLDGVSDLPVVGGYLSAAVDGMVGPMFEHGLGKLKALAEEPTAGPAAAGETAAPEPAASENNSP